MEGWRLSRVGKGQGGREEEDKRIMFAVTICLQNSVWIEVLTTLEARTQDWNCWVIEWVCVSYMDFEYERETGCLENNETADKML